MEPFVFTLIGLVVGVLVLYFVIRLAVRHGIQDVRELAAQKAPKSPSTSHLDADGL